MKDEPIEILCESFRDLGGWTLETQSTLRLGCGYLMAHGLGKPVADAWTTAEIPVSGRHAVWARTRNWNATWTCGAAGRFRILLDDAPLAAELGAGGAEWQWEKAGEAELPAGTVRVALRDLTGFNGRCAAIRLVPQGGGGLQSAVTDAARSGDRAPPEPQWGGGLQSAVTDAARSGDRAPPEPQWGGGLQSAVTDAARSGDCAPPEPQWGGGLQSAGPGSISDDPETYDLVVAGGGVAGVCAALSAARLGAKALLLQDRDVLGGCNSSEVCVAMGGRIHVPPYEALGNVVEEIQPLFGYGTPIEPRFHEDARKEAAFHVREHLATRGWERSVPGTTPGLRLGQYVIGVEMDPSSPRRIAAVLSRDTRTGAVTRIRARNFCDATGDALVARFAGCETMYGREGRARFGESCAPEAADRRVMGLSVQWLTEERPEAAPFPDISDWALPIREPSDCYRTCGSWEQETGFHLDQSEDAERIRDYALLCIFSNWNWLKNKAPDRDKFARLALKWMSPTGGKRESYRVVGDAVLTQRDLQGHADFPDATAAVTWDIDQHFPDPDGERAFPEPFRSAARHTGFGKPQPVPYRCLYARDCDNLFLAGRCISASSVAFAAVRVMRTLGMLGEVVGMAAAICAETGDTPRGVGELHLEKLKGMMRAGVPRLSKNFHSGNCDHDNVRYDFKRDGRHLIYNVPPDAIPPGIAADIAKAGMESSF